ARHQLSPWLVLDTLKWPLIGGLFRRAEIRLFVSASSWFPLTNCPSIDRAARDCFLSILIPLLTAHLATSLARAALGADAASAGPDHFVAPTMRADDIHEHVAERFFHSLGVSVASAHYFRVAFARRIARDHVDQFFLSRARQLGDRTIDRFLFHFRDFFQRKF